MSSGTHGTAASAGRGRAAPRAPTPPAAALKEQFCLKRTAPAQEKKPQQYSESEPSTPESALIAAGSGVRPSQKGYLDPVGFFFFSFSIFLVEEESFCNLTLRI